MYNRVVVVAALALCASIARSQEFGPVKESMWTDADATETVKLSVRSAQYVWERDVVGCHDDLTSAIENSAITPTAKVSLLVQIPKALRLGGIATLWKNASGDLRRAIMQAAADNLEGEAAKLEQRAALLRMYVARIDEGATSYTVGMGF